MQVEAAGFTPKRVTRVRPGHADLAGALKYGFDDVRNVLERASARETAARVAAGAVAKALLARVGIEVRSLVRRIGPVEMPPPGADGAFDAASVDWAAVEESPVRCPDPGTSAEMVAAIDAARAEGDTLGAHFAQGFQKQISCPNSSQKRPPLITAESNEMQIPAAGIAFWFDPHQSRNAHPFSEERVGHPRFSTFRLPQQVVSSLGGKTSSTISRQSNWPPAQVKLIEK